MGGGLVVLHSHRLNYLDRGATRNVSATLGTQLQPVTVGQNRYRRARAHVRLHCYRKVGRPSVRVLTAGTPKSKSLQTL